VAVLVNPANTETTLKDVEVAAGSIGLQIQVVRASTGPEIDAAFATIVRERPDALFVGQDGFFNSRACATDPVPVGNSRSDILVMQPA
jgi:putative ABC transport system substrate-binding protein